MKILNSLEKFAFGNTSKQEQDYKPSYFPSELETLINIAIEDGVLTDKERQVLYKKAAKFDVDSDELDMILESRLNKVKSVQKPVLDENQKETPVNPTVAKKKGPKRCPSCGALIPDENTVYCPDCGHKVINIVRDILEAINDVVLPPRPKKEKTNNNGLLGKAFGLVFGDLDSYNEEYELEKLQRKVILDYNVPIAKETVLEFLAFSIQKGRKKKDDFGHDDWDDELGEAWYTKSEQVITATRQAFGKDAEFMKKIKEYAVQIGMEKKGLFR